VIFEEKVVLSVPLTHLQDRLARNPVSCPMQNAPILLAETELTCFVLLQLSDALYSIINLFRRNVVTVRN